MQPARGLALLLHIEKHLNLTECGRVSMMPHLHFVSVMERVDFKHKYFLYLEYNIHIHTL
jgi:hypothetical protein